MKIEFEREKLYEEVWTTPLTKLGQKYGLSDNGVRKICKAMNIPLPHAGHWAKVAAGHVIKRPPLPPDASRTTFTSQPSQLETLYAEDEDARWLSERIAFENHPENRIVVSTPVTVWHPAIRPLRDKFRAEAVAMERARRAAEKPKPVHRFAREPQFVDWKFQEFLRSGGVLCHTHNSMALRITPGTLERALTIANTLCRESGKRGFEVRLTPGDTRIELAGHDVTVQARIAERLERRPVPGRQTISGQPETTLVATGQLALSVERPGWGEAKVSDGSEHPLEEQLNAVFQKIYRVVVRGWRQQRRWAAWERERQEAEQRALEEKRRREEEAARLKAEREKVEGLIAEAAHWQQAAVIRSYVSQVMQAAGNPSPALGKWSRWALEVAASVDPTARRLSGAN